MLPKSFALSDDEESVSSIPQVEYEAEQSCDEPICLNEYSSMSIELPHLSWHGYTSCPNSLTLTNTGETVSITGKWKKGRPYVACGPLNGCYLFSQIHFHWPSEHSLNERRYDLEMHAVHYKAAYLTEERAMKEADGTVVLVYLFEVGKEKTCMSKITCLLSSIRNKGNKVELSDSKLSEFIKPFISNYFIYWGSVDVAGSKCSLQWLISCCRLCISQSELCDLKELFSSGEGEQLRKGTAYSKPVPGSLFLVGCTVNASFTEGNRSEVKFSDVEECSAVPEKSKSCCLLAKCTRKNSKSAIKSNNSSDGSIEKLYLRQSNSQCSRSSRNSTSGTQNDNKTCNCPKQTCQCQQRTSCTEIKTSSGCLLPLCNRLSKQSCQYGSTTNSCETSVNNDASKCCDQNNQKGSNTSTNTDKCCREEEEKWNKKILKCFVRKNEIHDCLGNGCENQVCSPECDKNSCETKKSEQEGCKKTGKPAKRKSRDSSKCDSSSEENLCSNEKMKDSDTDSGTKKPKKEKTKEEDKSDTEGDVEVEPVVKKERNKKGNMFSWAKCKKSSKKETQPRVDPTPEKSKEMGQHGPIILAPATVGENHFILKSVGTMTNQPPPPIYTRGTDIIGEGSDFSGQGSSISSSQIWNRQKENRPKEKADKTITASECEEPEDLELLPSRRIVAEEAVQVQLESPRPISDDEQSLSSVFATLAKDPSLRKVVANISNGAFPVEETTTTTNIQSITNLLNKMAEDKQIEDLLKKVSGSEKFETEDYPLSNLSQKPSSDKALRQMAVQTELLSATVYLNKSDKESGSKVLTEKASTMNDITVGELTPEKSKRSFIVNALTELKDSGLVAELLKSSKETLLAGVMALALKGLSGPEKEVATVSILAKASREGMVSANAATQTLSQIITCKASKTFSGSSNTPTKANKEISESGTSLKTQKSRTSRKPPEPGVSGNRSKQNSSVGTLTKASKNASGSIESTQSHTGRSSVAQVESPKHLSGSKESTNTQKRGEKALNVSRSGESTHVPLVNSSICLFENTSKNILSPDRREISLVSILSKISKDPGFAKDLASILRNKDGTGEADSSVSVTDFIGKEPSLPSNVSRKDSSSHVSGDAHKRASKRSPKGSDKKKGRIEPEVVEVHKKVLSDRSTSGDLAKTLLTNALHATLKEKSSADLGTSAIRQSLVSLTENQSMNSGSRQSLPANISAEESSTSRKASQTLSNQLSQNLLSSQQIMELSSSKEQVLIEILDNFRTAFPAAAEIVKNISWVDILVTALKDSSHDPISRATSATSNISGRELLPGRVKSSADRSTIKSGEQDSKISVPEDSTAKPDLKRDSLIDVLVDTLKAPFHRKTSSASLRSSDEGDISVINKLTKLSAAEARESLRNETLGTPKKSSLSDVLIEVLDKHPVAPEKTMSPKNSSAIKRPEKISRESSLTDNKNDASHGIKEVTKTNYRGKGLKRETRKGHSVLTGFGGGRVAENAGSGKSTNCSINHSDTSQGSAEDPSNTGRNRRDQERNRVNFETGSNQNAVATERPEVEKLHRQEDLNESIKSRRSTDTKRSADDDSPSEVRKKLPEEEAEMGGKTKTTEEEAVTKPKKPDKDNEAAVYFKARFLTKDNGGVDSSDNISSEDSGNGSEVTKAEEAGTSEDKPMYFISEAIDVDPETGKKVLTGRFVTHNKCKTVQLHYLTRINHMYQMPSSTGKERTFGGVVSCQQGVTLPRMYSLQVSSWRDILEWKQSEHLPYMF